MSKSAVVYARFSTSEQSKGYSLERQHSLGVAYAGEKGWIVEGNLVDHGRSAFHGANRLEGAALHNFELEARNGLHRGKVLVAENIDRLSRQGAKAAAQLIWGLNEHGVDVATYHDDHVYSATTNGDMMDLFKLIIDAQQAHEESKKRSKRTADTWVKRFVLISEGAKDIPVPGVPKWIDWRDGKYVLNEYRSKILNDIYDLYIDGVGIHRIVVILNRREEPVWTPLKHSRNSNGWFYGYIYRLLTKRSVLGEYVTTGGTTISTDFFPQAITAEKWSRAQAALSLRKSNQKRSINANRNLLAGLVFCSECGGGAHFEHTTNSVQRYTKVSGEVVNYRRKTYRRLRCDRARRGLSCNNETVLSYDIVEKTILDELLPRIVQSRDQSILQIDLRENLSELVRFRQAAESRVTNLVDALSQGGPKSIVERIVALEAEIDRLSTEIVRVKKDLDTASARPSRDADAGLVHQLRLDLASDDDDIRIYARGRTNMALRRLINRIEIGDGTFIVWTGERSWWLFEEDGALVEGEAVIRPNALSSRDEEGSRQ